MKKIYLFFTIVVTVSTLLFVAKPILLNYYVTDTPFDSSLWTSMGSNRGQFTHRQLMVKHLIVEILPGKNRAYVEHFLGEPEASNKRTVSYILGKERTILSLKTEILKLIFDEDNNYIKHEIITD